MWTSLEIRKEYGVVLGFRNFQCAATKEDSKKVFEIFCHVYPSLLHVFKFAIDSDCLRVAGSLDRWFAGFV